MRVVLDTNVFVSGLLSRSGPPARIVQALLQGRLIAFIATIRAAAYFVEPQRTHIPLRDEEDRMFLDLMATDPPPQYFVTGDKDFEASHYSGVPVISAAEFVALLK